MSDNEIDNDAERMLQAALGGMSATEALIAQTRAEREDVAGRAAAIAKNRERALRLLEALEKSGD